jgi:hypothetical protein
LSEGMARLFSVRCMLEREIICRDRAAISVSDGSPAQARNATRLATRSAAVRA